MPYITQEERDVLLKNLATPQKAGELNYMFTKLVTDYIASKGLSYQTINDVYGAFEGAKLEFARRVGNGYEDAAIKRNGDVY